MRAIRCVWQSMSPGRMVALPRSITRAPAGGCSRSPAARMRSPSTMTTASCSILPARTSSMRAARTATTTFSARAGVANATNATARAQAAILRATAARGALQAIGRGRAHGDERAALGAGVPLDAERAVVRAQGLAVRFERLLARRADALAGDDALARLLDLLLFDAGEQGHAPQSTLLLHP